MHDLSFRRRRRDAANWASGAATILFVGCTTFVGCATGDSLESKTARTAPQAPAYTETSRLSPTGPGFIRGPGAVPPFSAPLLVAAPASLPPDLAVVEPLPVPHGELPASPRVKAIPKVEACYVATRMVARRLPPLSVTSDADAESIRQVASDQVSAAADAGSVLAATVSNALDLDDEALVHRLPAVVATAAKPNSTSDNSDHSRNRAARNATAQDLLRVQITSVRPVEKTAQALQ